MRTWLWKNATRWVAGGLLGAALMTGSARADDEDAIGDLKRRIEALEQQNQRLLKQIDTDVAQPAAGAVVPNAAALESAVRGILDKKDDEKKAAAAAAAKAAEDAGYTVGSDLKMNARWNPARGILFETPNKDFYLHVGGRFNYDSVWWTQDAFLQPNNQVGTLTDGGFFRRARLNLDGGFWEVFEFDMQFDLEQQDQRISNFDELFVGVQKLPGLGTVRLGHQKVPQGLESLSSSRVLTFMERSALFDAFWEEFGTGVFASNTILDEHGTWSAMAYRSERANNGADFGDGEYSAAGRLTILPYYENEGRCLLHLGASAKWRKAERLDPGLGQPSVVRFRARPEMRDAVGDYGTAPLPGNSARWVDTGNIVADTAQVYGAELLGIFGPLSIQAEGTAAVATNVNDDELGFYGYYVTASYFLTGEHRSYDRRFGRLGTPYSPRIHTHFWAVEDENCERNVGLGAWEIAARYSWVNLNDQNVNGGKLSEYTFGLNWYLCPNAKIQFQYLNVQRKDVGAAGFGGVPQRSGEAQGFGIRTVLDF